MVIQGKLTRVMLLSISLGVCVCVSCLCMCVCSACCFPRSLWAAEAQGVSLSLGAPQADSTFLSPLHKFCYRNSKRLRKTGSQLLGRKVGRVETGVCVWAIPCFLNYFSLRAAEYCLFIRRVYSAEMILVVSRVKSQSPVIKSAKWPGNYCCWWSVWWSMKPSNGPGFESTSTVR